MCEHDHDQKTSKPHTEQTNDGGGAPKPALSPEVSAKVELVARSLRFAQHAYDRAVALQGGGTNQLLGELQLGTRGLREALRSLEGADVAKVRELLRTPFDDARQVLHRIRSEGLDPDESEAFKDAARVEDTIGLKLGIRMPVSIYRTYVPVRGTSSSTAVSTALPLLEVVRLVGARCLREVHAITQSRVNQVIVYSNDRNAIVTRAVAELRPHLEHLEVLLRGIGDADLPMLKPAFERASDPLLQLRGWIHPRTATMALSATLEPIVESMDRGRLAVGLGRIGELTNPPSPQNEDDERDDEKRDLEARQTIYNEALAGLFSELNQGVDLFKDFAALQREESNSNWSSIATGVLAAFLGNIGALVAGAVVAKGLQAAAGAAARAAATAANRTIGAAYVDFTKSFSSDALQVLFAGVAHDAVKSAANAEHRERTLFAHASKSAHVALKSLATGLVATNIARQSISSDELIVMTRSVEQHTVDAQTRAYLNVSQSYARMLAHRTVGRSHGVTHLDGYFGERGGVQPGANARDRTARGVAVIGVLLRDEKDGVHTDVGGFSVKGVNGDTRLAIAQNANYEVAKLGIPMEVHVTMPLHAKRAVVVIDERGQIGDDKNWEALLPSGADVRMVQEHLALYRTPAAFWSLFKTATIPHTTAALKDGE